jgi:hypothetical protein
MLKKCNSESQSQYAMFSATYANVLEIGSYSAWKAVSIIPKHNASDPDHLK